MVSGVDAGPRGLDAATGSARKTQLLTVDLDRCCQVTAVRDCNGQLVRHRVAWKTPVAASGAPGTCGDSAAAATASNQSAPASSADTWAAASAANLSQAAALIRGATLPVAFPTETVFGLGADATRDAVTANVFRAKGRPADNPLIVHVDGLDMLRRLLRAGDGSDCAPPASDRDDEATGQPDPELQRNGDQEADGGDVVPAIYRPLISKFWPGPLTMIMPLPEGSVLSPLVTAGLRTFGARIPRSPLALALIALSGRPVAAPSANLSTRPSPTTAAHVIADLEGRIDAVVDYAPGTGPAPELLVGVESTVVDGVSDPLRPAVLRPGGIGIDELRACPGWENVREAYRATEGPRAAGEELSAPRAPGMKYRHYSPRARLTLHLAGARAPYLATANEGAESGAIGVVRTTHWIAPPSQHAETTIYDVHLGPDPTDVARGLFAALRDLDTRKVTEIHVEGLPESGHGDDVPGVTAAVMNRLRKAATEIVPAEVSP